MTFELMRAGWPNTATIAALALVPILVALTTDWRLDAAPVGPEATCQTTASCGPVVVATASDALE